MSDGCGFGVDSCESDRCEFRKRNSVDLHKRVGNEEFERF